MFYRLMRQVSVPHNSCLATNNTAFPALPTEGLMPQSAPSNSIYDRLSKFSTCRSARTLCITAEITHMTAVVLICRNGGTYLMFC
jgi:hypothetical protein